MMIETNLMRGWVGIVESIALFAITVLAVGLILGAVKISDVMKHLGAILGVLILLLMLPAIIASVWSSMFDWEHLGIVIILIGLSIAALRKERKRA
jgi:hypothetical protein